jgi:hypothetical protein
MTPATTHEYHLLHEEIERESREGSRFTQPQAAVAEPMADRSQTNQQEKTKVTV